MNATLFDGGKVHWLNGPAARCGVGKHRQAGHWQMELGAVSCLRCARLNSATDETRRTHGGRAARALTAQRAKSVVSLLTSAATQ